MTAGGPLTSGQPRRDVWKPLPSGFVAFSTVRPEPELVRAAREGDRAGVVQAVRHSNEDVDAVDQHGRTALHEAASGGHYSVASTLLDLGRGYSIDINRQDNMGQTPLAAAAAAGSDKVLQLLLQAGADPRQPDTRGVTPLMLAVEQSSLQCLRLLLKTPANPPDVDATDCFGSTALMRACAAEEQKRCAELLLSHGASPNEADKRGRSALHLAAELGSLDLVKQLHRAGADLQARDGKGLLPINMASDKAVVEYLDVEMRRFALYRQQFVVPLSRLPLQADSGDTLMLRVVDMEKGAPVILKFFRHKSQRNHLLETILQLEQDFVASVPADTSIELPRYVFKDSNSYTGMPYCLVLFAGERTLEEAMSQPCPSRGPVMPLAEVKHIFRSVTECVEHIHGQGLVHCNLKPASVMQFFDGHFRLVSMGAACMVGKELEEHTTTLEICPPEVAKAWLRETSVKASSARDVWALGCILYEMLVGRKLLSDLVKEAEEEVSRGGPAPPVPPTELLGVLDLISKVKQEQISELVAAPRLMQCRRDVYHKKPAHQMTDDDLDIAANIGDGSPVKSRRKSEGWMRNLQRKMSPTKLPSGIRSGSSNTSLSSSSSSSLNKSAPGSGSTPSQRAYAAAPEVGCMSLGRRTCSGREPGVEFISDSGLMTESESALLALSELLSKMLRINPLERVEATEMLQNAVLKAVSATADDNVVEEMKTLKRAAAQTQQQMYHRWLELDAQMKELMTSISTHGSSSAASASVVDPTDCGSVAGSSVQAAATVEPVASSEQTSAVSESGDGATSVNSGKSGHRKSKTSRLGSSLFSRSRRSKNGRASISLPAYESTAPV